MTSISVLTRYSSSSFHGTLRSFNATGAASCCICLLRYLRSCLMQVASGSIPLYAVLPAVTEWVVESGYTRAYSRISDVGLGRYWAYFALYIVSIEFFVYWMHRGLHDVKIGYR